MMFWDDTDFVDAHERAARTQSRHDMNQQEVSPSPPLHAAKKSWELNGPLHTESMQHTRA